MTTKRSIDPLRPPGSLPARQQGAALLLIMLAMLVAATAAIVTRLSTDQLRNREVTAGAHYLSAARSALLAYATIRPDLPGGGPELLPCPDLDDSGGLAEGESHEASCGAAGQTVVGRVPWRTLGIEPPRDGSGACLWYVVSGSWKAAGAATTGMVNPDNNGLLELWGVESAAVVAGRTPAERPVAAILAPGRPLPGQNRSAAGNRQCSADFNAANFLDTDAGTGISNASFPGAADRVGYLAVTAGRSDDHNDRIALITRADLETIITRRPDFDQDIRALGLAVAECLADFGRNNSGGASDLRLPWPAPMRLADYRLDSLYDDVNVGVLSGRVPDTVDDSGSEIGNSIARVLTDCDPARVPAWSVDMLDRWRNWKDHFFYLVAQDFAPDASIPSACVDCPTVNSAGRYAAVVAFAGSRLEALAQVRDAPPTDADTRDDIGNYLEAANASAFPYTSGPVDLTARTPDASFNDILFCIDESLAVSEC
ncbi:MAG: hypothetical protein AAFX10_09605 [Pseudomonadota bacterium]